MKTHLFLFRNDLRLADNPALWLASRQADRLICLYVWDSRLEEKHPAGFTRMGQYRKKFLLESLQDLKKSLEKAGNKLVFREGSTAEIVLEIAKEFSVDRVFCSDEAAFEERRDNLQIANRIPTEIVPTHFLFSESALPFSVHELPNTFTAFRKAVEKRTPLRKSFPEIEKLPPVVEGLIEGNLPQTPEIKKHPNTAFPFRGGRSSGLARLEDYLFQTHAIEKYKETRNGLIGTEYSSKFSAWLSVGALSNLEIYRSVEEYEENVESNDSTYWMKFELLWKEYFRWLGVQQGVRIFHKKGLKNQAYPMKKNPNLFKKWIEGQTGDPFVDANMRELAQTGWMSNRGRQNVASYFVHQLKLDWRWGAAWFEHNLVDYDVYSNQGNWLYLAGLGNDPRENRVFNTRKQADQYDPKGEYQKIWLQF